MTAPEDEMPHERPREGLAAAEISGRVAISNAILAEIEGRMGRIEEAIVMAIGFVAVMAAIGVTWWIVSDKIGRR